MDNRNGEERDGNLVIALGIGGNFSPLEVDPEAMKKDG